MKKKVAIMVAVFVLAGCGGEKKKIPEQCKWTTDCPQGWVKDGDTCVFQGEVVSLSGTVEVYVLGNKVKNAVVRIMDFDQLIPPCGVSDEDGFVKIEGIPVGTDVTVKVEHESGFNGKPTYYFHFVGRPITQPVEDETFVLINQALGNSILQITGVQPVQGKGVMAGAVVNASTGEYVEGATVAVEKADETTQIFYIKGLNADQISTDKSGAFAAINVPPGETEVYAYYPQGATQPAGKNNAVVYEGAVSIVGVPVIIQ